MKSQHRFVDTRHTACQTDSSQHFHRSRCSHMVDCCRWHGGRSRLCEVCIFRGMGSSVWLTSSPKKQRHRMPALHRRWGSALWPSRYLALLSLVSRNHESVSSHIDIFRRYKKDEISKRLALFIGAGMYARRSSAIDKAHPWHDQAHWLVLLAVSSRTFLFARHACARTESTLATAFRTSREALLRGAFCTALSHSKVYTL
jgi:hypothetical protein